MPVYVDRLRRVGNRAPKCFGGWACHMAADDPVELNAMAKQIGLRREWLHGDHYDLSASKRRLAIRLGALPVHVLDLVDLRQKHRR